MKMPQYQPIFLNRSCGGAPMHIWMHVSATGHVGGEVSLFSTADCSHFCFCHFLKCGVWIAEACSRVIKNILNVHAYSLNFQLDNAKPR
jgi:hypothetical protein